ncbi:MAG: hypothetical protein GY761_07685 [Hyphomicrobiales bacterium]|nr:hypothetical protein [Hyphomicrobiales bacterium]
MIKQNEVPVVSCPACEFMHGHAGQPVSHANGSLTCNICDSKWRNLNSIQDTNGEPKAYSQQFLEQVTFAHTPNIDDMGQSKSDHKIKHRSVYSAIPVIISCALIILATGYSYQVLQSNTSVRQEKIQTTPLTLDNIKIEDKWNNQASFWTITARITNNTIHSVTVPPVQMRSGSKGSSGYFGWTYRPALQKLSPGSNLTIRTSIHKPVGSSKNIEMEFADNNLKSG